MSNIKEEISQLEAELEAAGKEEQMPKNTVENIEGRTANGNSGDDMVENGNIEEMVVLDEV